MSYLTSLEMQIENNLRKQIGEFGYLTGNKERYTLDGEWSESELEADLQDEAMLLLRVWTEKNKFRAVKDKDLLYPEFLANKVMEENDLIEMYNKAYDKHRNDKDRKFGIHYFDDVIKTKMNKLLKENLITK